MSWQVICNGTDVTSSMINGFKFQDIFDYVSNNNTTNIQVLLNGITINDFDYYYPITSYQSVTNFSVTGISGNPALCNMAQSISPVTKKCTITFTNIHIKYTHSGSGGGQFGMITAAHKDIELNLMNCILDGNAKSAGLEMSQGTLSITNTTIQNFIGGGTSGNDGFGIHILDGDVKKLDFNNISDNNSDYNKLIHVSPNINCDIFVHGNITDNKCANVFSFNNQVQGNVQIYGNCTNNTGNVIDCSITGSLLGNLLIHGDCISNGRVVYGTIKGNITILGNCYNNSNQNIAGGLIYLDKISGPDPTSITVNNCTGNRVLSKAGAIFINFVENGATLNIYGNFNNNSTGTSGGVVYVSESQGTINMYGSYNSNTAINGGVVYINGGGILNMYGNCSGNKTINGGDGCIVYVEPGSKSGEINLKSSCVGYGDADPKDIVHINSAKPVKLIGNYPIGAHVKY